MHEAVDLYVARVTAFQQNCSVLVCRRTHHAVVIDPGGDLSLVLRTIERSGGIIQTILLTHGHIDHAGGADELREILQVPVVGPNIGDAPLLARIPTVGPQYGLLSARAVQPDRWLNEGDRVSVGALTLKALHCPGHTAGSVTLVVTESTGEASCSAGLAFVGDILFQGKIGPPGPGQGDRELLLRSVRTRLLPLGDEVTFVSGHGGLSTIGLERRTNPLLS